MFALRNKNTKEILCISAVWDCAGSEMILEEGSGDCVYVVQDRRELESLLDEFNAGGNPKSTEFPVIINSASPGSYEILQLWEMDK